MHIHVYVAIQLLTLELPYGNTPDQMTATLWYEQLMSGRAKITLPITVPSSLKAKVEAGLQPTPDDRPELDEILECIIQLISTSKS